MGDGCANPLYVNLMRQMQLDHDLEENDLLVRFRHVKLLRSLVETYISIRNLVELPIMLIRLA